MLAKTYILLVCYIIVRLYLP